MTVLEFLRLQRGLSKAEAARLVRMLPSEYALVERGLRAPGEQAEYRLAAEFGYGVEALVADASGLIDEGLLKRGSLR